MTAPATELRVREEAKAFVYECPLCKTAVDLDVSANVYDEEADEAIHAECVASYRENQNEAAYERSLGDAWAGGFAENH